jgi:1,4-dihydroxy-2-naphthoyl-CoA hydrolase
MTDESQGVDNSLSRVLGNFVELIGLQVHEASPDRVVGSLDIRPDLLQPYGILHGGVLCSIVETLASIGAAMWFGDLGNVVGVSNSTDFIRASRTGTLDAVSTPVHRGRSAQLWLVEIHDSSQRLIARGQVRLANIADADRLAVPSGTTPTSV